jgi:hypothetical protein
MNYLTNVYWQGAGGKGFKIKEEGVQDFEPLPLYNLLAFTFCSLPLAPCLR